MNEELKVPEGWTLLVEGEWVEALRCRYPDPDVLVSIHKSESGYEVRESVERDASDPKKTVAGTRESLAAARELMLKTCRDWDEWILRRPTIGCS
jgi:hypothetical protein